MLAQPIFAYFTRETLFINLEVVMRENFALLPVALMLSAMVSNFVVLKCVH